MDQKSWIDKGTYIESTASQGSENWFEIRNTLIDGLPILTGSRFGDASGVGYDTREDLALYMLKIKKREYDEKSKKRMEHGVHTEKIARQWYEKMTGNKVTDAGFAIPKFDPRIGSSLDGHVDDDEQKLGKGSIEIKCPERMYNDSKIKPSHYAQMQGGMAITGKDWCDYVVYSTNDGYASIERVKFDQVYWIEVLYPSLCSFIEYMGQVKKEHIM